MNKEFFAVIVLVIAGLVGIFVLTGSNGNGGGNGNGGAGGAQPSSHITGDVDSSVKLVEYLDFQCPACKGYHPIMQELKKSHGDRVAFQLRHFPLTQIHPNAFVASRAAEAAGKQGKFFEMHDLLFENQDAWGQASNPVAIFEGYAKQLGLNLEQFKTDMNSPEVAATINADIKEAQEVGATSTPTFVLNGRKLEQPPRSVEDFKKLLDEELAKNSQSQ